MSLEAKIMDHMKEAMKAKDSVALEALRAIKSAIILAKTEAGAGDGLSEDQEIKMLQRLVDSQTGNVKSICQTILSGLNHSNNSSMVIPEEFKSMFLEFEKD